MIGFYMGVKPVSLRAQIERITYTNEENGYTVAKVKVLGERHLITIVGNIAAPTPGEILMINGKWSDHPKYGEQFNITSYKVDMPATAYGITKYLGSGLIKGIGPKIAKKIVDVFQEKTLDIIEEDIDKLRRVEGIGKKTYKND